MFYEIEQYKKGQNVELFWKAFKDGKLMQNGPAPVN